MNTLHNANRERDVEILRRISHRDEKALETLYDYYSTLLYGIIFRMVGTKVESENILQDVFMQVWNRSVSYNSLLGAPLIWLIRIAKNKSIDFLRSRPAHQRSQETRIEAIQTGDSDVDTDDPYNLLSSSQIGAIVRDAMNSLPQFQKELIALAYYEGYSQSELAEKFSIPLGTIKSRMRAGLIALREQLTTMSELHQ